MERAELADRWRRLFGAGTAEVAGEVFADLVRRYGEPARHYHTLDHITAVLDTIAQIEAATTPEADAPGSPIALLLAGWLHDVVYDSRASDNEERSAEYARALPAALNVPAEVRKETARLILLTKSHTTAPGDRAGEMLLDADLAVLGAEPCLYADYAAAIRREYAWVSESDYRAGRRRVLERFLSRPRVYFTAWMAARAEARARDNLAREIARL
jgi:predicted metal-dependent HD superfamily phosphohydrolase